MKVINCLIIILVIFICIINKPQEQYTIETYTVQPGDTAWRIAEQFNGNNKDIREIIYYMKIDNNIKPGYIFPGQVIKVRSYETR